MKGTRIIVLVCVVALVVAGGWYTLIRPKDTLRISADFVAADGIFPGNEVHVLGVPVGSVRSLEPRGGVVRVEMELAADTKIPAGAHAFIMNPEVISDRFIELNPAHTEGATLADGAVIPVDRAHAPVRWDELMSSMDTILTALGPDGKNVGTDIGSMLHDAAGAVGGEGQEFRDAVNTLAQATDVVAGNKEDISLLLANLDRLVRVLTENKQTIDSLKSTVSQASEDYGLDRADLNSTIGRLSNALAEVDALVEQHGAELSETLSNTAETSRAIAEHQDELAEIMDVLPLTFGNFSNAITEDERLRIRLNVSSNLSQFPATAELCRKFPVPLCSGAGLVNPIPLPPNLDVPSQLETAPNGGG